jgi:uroporphyrinogen decarboxylase
MDSLKRFKYLMTRRSEKLDRILVDYWASSDVDQRLCIHFKVKNREELLERLDIDFRYIDGPRYIGPKLKKYSDCSENDIWGVPRKRIDYGKGG